MPTLDEFKKIQILKSTKENLKEFQPKRYAPYLLQEEVIQNDIDVIKDEKKTKRKKSKERSQNIKNPFSSEVSFKQNDTTIKNLSPETSCDSLMEKITKLYGLQKKALFFISEVCEKNKGLTTPPITSEVLRESIKTTYKTVKKIIARLIDNNLLIRKHGKRGRGGFSVFEITQEVKDALEEYKKLSNITSLYFCKNQFKSCSETSITSSDVKLPDEWTNIKFASLEDIGFSKLQLKQLCESGLATPDIVQKSIYHFAFSLQHNERVKSHDNPLNMLMGVLRKGNVWIESNYESPQDKAMREWVEKEEKQKKLREEQRMKMFNLAFDKWLDSLTEDEAREIFHNENPNSRIPFKGKSDSGFSQAMLRNYYRKKIWVNERKELGLDGFWDHFNDDETQ